MKKILLLLSVFALSGTANAQWVKQNTLFPDPSVGVQSITPFSANDVWAIGYDGSAAQAIIQSSVKTTNGGTTWTPSVIDIGQIDYGINNLSAVSMSKAWISAINGAGPTYPAGIWQTLDGGATWNQQAVGTFSDPGSFLDWVHFFDENIGVAEGDPINPSDFEMMRTSDGGATWTLISGANLPNIIAGEAGLNGGNVGNANSFWFVTNKGKIYHTGDKGLSWDKFNSPIPDFAGTNSAGKIFFKDDNIGCLLARTGTIATGTWKLHTTTNAGSTWSAGVSTVYREISYVPGSNLMYGTAGAVSGFSADNGTTWTVIDTGVQRTDVAFFDASVGWAGGFNVITTVAPITNTGGIFKYTPPLASVSFSNDKIFTVFPNPSSGLFKLTGADINNVLVTDVLGKVIFENSYSSITNVDINLESVNAGVYMVKVTNNEGRTSVVKVVKQ